jgi:hypothetical protein
MALATTSISTSMPTRARRWALATSSMSTSMLHARDDGARRPRTSNLDLEPRPRTSTSNLDLEPQCPRRRDDVARDLVDLDLS